MRIIGLDIHRIFAEAVAWNDGKLERLGTLSEVKRITNAPGYDGGASFSPDCRKIVWHASRPKPEIPPALVK